MLKIQVGDYPYRYQADAKKDIFRKNGFPGAWVILRTILIPFGTDSTGAVSPAVEQQPVTEPAKPIINTGKYKIQIIAMGSEERAREITADIKQKMNLSAFYEKSGNLFKVFVGYFNVEQEARNALEKIREGGFPDAWLVY